MDFHGSQSSWTPYEKCCILTTWKFIEFHVNQSLATNGNERFVWVVVYELRTQNLDPDQKLQFWNCVDNGCLSLVDAV